MVKINIALVNIHIWPIFYHKLFYYFSLSEIIHDFNSYSIIVIYGMVLNRNIAMLEYTIISIMITDIIFVLLESTV